MKRDTTEAAAEATEEKLFDNWFDPVETILRSKVRGFLETMIEEELEAALVRPRYGRRPSRRWRMPRPHHRSAIDMAIGHGRSLAPLGGPRSPCPAPGWPRETGKTTEWKSKALRSYQRRTATVDALIASPICLEPTRGGCGARSLPYSLKVSARTWSAGSGAK